MTAMVRVVALVALFLVLTVAVAVAAALAAGPPYGTFMNVNPAVVLAYFLYPVLMFVGPTLLVVALLFVLGAAIEGRRLHERR